MHTISDEYIEPDAPWFGPDWAIHHPDFPFASAAGSAKGHRR